MTKEDIQKTIEGMIERTAFHVGRIDSTVNDDDGSVWFTVSSNDSHLFIGRNGETLDAFNHLLRRMIETKTIDSPAPFNVILDVNDYQKKRLDNLKAVAHMMAERARFYKASVQVDPMNAFERKIIHMFLEKHKDIKTESEGMGPTRHIVIKYVGNNA